MDEGFIEVYVSAVYYDDSDELGQVFEFKMRQGEFTLTAELDLGQFNLVVNPSTGAAALKDFQAGPMLTEAKITVTKKVGGPRTEPLEVYANEADYGLVDRLSSRGFIGAADYLKEILGVVSSR
jgi:hypothetical protein